MEEALEKSNKLLRKIKSTHKNDPRHSKKLLKYEDYDGLVSICSKFKSKDNTLISCDASGIIRKIDV
jgi:hypothetical protein